MVVQVHQQQVQRMTTTPTRWRVTKVNRNNNNNNNEKEQTKILSCFVLLWDIMSYLTFLSYMFDYLLLQTFVVSVPLHSLGNKMASTAAGGLK
jgi:hypothetical protein